MKRQTVPSPTRRNWLDLLIDAELVFGGLTAFALIRWLA